MTNLKQSGECVGENEMTWRHEKHQTRQKSSHLSIPTVILIIELIERVIDYLIRATVDCEKPK